MGVWSFETVVHASPNFTPGLTVRGLGNIDEFDAVQEPSGEPSPLEQNWKDVTTGVDTWQNFEFPGGNLSSAPVAVSRLDNPGRLYVFAIGNLDWNQRSSGPVSLIYWNWAAGLTQAPAIDGWTPSVSLPDSAGAVANVTPAVVAWAAGRVDVFAVSTSNTLLHWWLTEEPWNSSGPNPGDLGSFNGPETLGNVDTAGVRHAVTGPPAAVSWASGRLDVFAGAQDGSLLHWWYQAGAWVFGAPEIIGQAKWPCAVSWAPSRLDVFATSPGNDIVHWWYDATVTPIQSFGGSGQPAILGGSNNCGPASAVSWGPGRFDVFACSEQGQLLHWWHDSGGAGLNAPDTLLAGLQPSGNQVQLQLGPPACASAGPNNLEVMATAALPGAPYILDHWTWAGP